MSRKLNTATIGLFIIVGVALGVGGLVLFSSAKLFSQTKEVIVYFDNSLNGLEEGSPVKFRGVTIGYVKRVMIRFNQKPNDYSLPVILELEEKLLRHRLGDQSNWTFSREGIEQGVGDGLRATLELQSIVTNVLYVGLDFHVDAPPPVLHQIRKVYLEIPSEPTEVQQLMNNLASLDLKSIERNLNALLKNLNGRVDGLDLAQLQDDITKVLRSVDRLVSSGEIKNDLVTLQATLDQFRLLGEKLTNRIDPLADEVTRTLKEAERALVQVRAAAQNVRILLAPDGPVPNDLDQALRELAAAAQSLSSLLDFLKEHPNALISGRARVESKP